MTWLLIYWQARDICIEGAVHKWQRCEEGLLLCETFNAMPIFNVSCVKLPVIHTATALQRSVLRHGHNCTHIMHAVCKRQLASVVL